MGLNVLEGRQLKNLINYVHKDTCIHTCTTLYKFSEIYPCSKISKTGELSWDKYVLKGVEKSPSTRRCEMHGDSHSPKDLSIAGYSLHTVDNSERKISQHPSAIKERSRNDLLIKEVREALEQLRRVAV